MFFPFLSAVSSDCENIPLDIAIVIDQTKSVGKGNYDMMLDSIKSLIDTYDVGEDKTHFSIVTYAKDAEVRVSLDDPKYHSNEALEDLLDEMKEKDKLGSPTRTDVALKTVGEEVFVGENGDRQESPNILIVFTDGKTSKSSQPYDTVIPKLEVRTCMLGQTAKLERIRNFRGRQNYYNKNHYSSLNVSPNLSNNDHYETSLDGV